MEQVEGGDLVVNKGEESKPKESLNDQAGRELGGVEGFDAALKLAKVRLFRCFINISLLILLILGKHRRFDQEQP